MFWFYIKAMWNTIECKRDSFNGSLGGASETHWECVSHCLNDFERIQWSYRTDKVLYSIISQGDSFRVTTPTATETVLPWKREDDYDTARPVQQNEFPAWCSNKEYLAYSSPSATFLGGIEQPKIQSVIGLFRRESNATPDIPDIEDPDESDEYTAMRPASTVSPTRKLGRPP